MATTVTQFKERNPQWGQSFDRLAWLKEQESKKPKQEKSKKGSGNQSWLSSIISELSGAGGAAGGAAIGAGLGSVVPGIGNIVGGIAGGIIGGFGGGTVGRLAENQWRDNEMRLGDALKEGAVSGAFGAVGPAWQGVRGLQTLGKAGNAGFKGGLTALSGITDDAARATAGKAISRGGAKAGTSVARAISSGGDDITKFLGQGGAKSAGAKGIGAFRPEDDGLRSIQKTAERVATKNQYKIPSGFKGLQKAEKTLDLLDADLAKVLKGKTLSRPQITSLVDDIYNNTGADVAEATLNRSKKSLLQKIANATNPDGSINASKFREIRSAIGKDIFKGTTTSSKELKQEVYHAMGDALRSTVKESDELLKQQRNILDLAPGLVKQSKEVRVPFFGASITAPGGAALRDRGYDAASGLTQALSTTGGRMAKRTAQGAISRGIVNGGEAPMPEGQVDPMQEEMQMLQSSMVNPGQGGMADMINGYDQPQDPAQYNPYAPENLQTSIAQIMQQGGDMGDVKDFLSIATALDKLGASDEQELTAIQRNKIAGYNTANTVVDSLEQLWQGVSQPGNQGLAGLSGLPGVKQARSTFDPSVRQYTQFAEGTLAPIIKSLGETGVLTDRDIIRAYGLVPNLQDSPDVASNKIQQLRALLTNAEMATADQGGGGSQDALADILAAQQYAPY